MSFGTSWVIPLVLTDVVHGLPPPGNVSVRTVIAECWVSSGKLGHVGSAVPAPDVLPDVPDAPPDLPAPVEGLQNDLGADELVVGRTRID
jgi:hypothetical protein